MRQPLGRTTVPRLGGISHIGLTVADVEASEARYARVLGLTRLFDELHHRGTGHTVVLRRPDSPQFSLGLDKHDANQGERFDECRTGLGHVAFYVADRGSSTPGRSTWTGRVCRKPALPSAPSRSRTPSWCSATPTTSSWS